MRIYSNSKMTEKRENIIRIFINSQLKKIEKLNEKQQLTTTCIKNYFFSLNFIVSVFFTSWEFSGGKFHAYFYSNFS